MESNEEYTSNEERNPLQSESNNYSQDFQDSSPNLDTAYNSEDSSFNNFNSQNPLDNYTQRDKFNTSMALLMGFIGLALGATIGYYGSINLPIEISKSASYIVATVLGLFFALSFGYLGGKSLKTSGAENQDKLEPQWYLVIIVLSIIISPVITGIIFYLIWKDKYPRKALTARNMGAILLLFYVVAIIYLFQQKFNITKNAIQKEGKEFIEQKEKTEIEIKNTHKIGEKVAYKDVEVTLTKIEDSEDNDARSSRVVPKKDFLLKIKPLKKELLISSQPERLNVYLFATEFTGLNGVGYPIDETDFMILKPINIKVNEEKIVRFRTDDFSKAQDNVYLLFDPEGKYTNRSNLTDSFNKSAYLNKDFVQDNIEGFVVWKIEK